MIFLQSCCPRWASIPTPCPAGGKAGPHGQHVRRWIDDLGLDEDAILEVARETRGEHPEPPDGPKALDRAMQRAQRA